MRYQLEEKLKSFPSFLYGLQWWLVTVPAIVVMGLVVAKLHFGADIAAQTFYMQKLLLILGVTLLCQVLLGHKLPLVVGPASVLLIGVLASVASGVSAIYTAIMVGGVFITIIALCGLLKFFQKIFTPRVIAAILLLIPITLSPTIIKLIFSNPSTPIFNLTFVLATIVALVICNQLLRGIWKSTTLVWGIVIASLLYYVFVGYPTAQPIANNSSENIYLFIKPELDLGVILSFLFCSFVLIINEVASIQAVGHMLGADNMQKRAKRGVAINGLSNIASGAMGVMGSVDYSSSPGIISATKCASRFPFIPTAILLIASAFVPGLVRGLLSIPNMVMGTILLYVMTTQFSAGIQMAVVDKVVSNFNDGISIGLSMMVAIAISFMPTEMAKEMPAMLRPILSNGFVMGVFMMLIMEHLVFRKNRLSNN